MLFLSYFTQVDVCKACNRETLLVYAGTGLQVMAETNCPSCPSGVYPLWTPVLGGTYLATYVLTHNSSSPAPLARLRREWFVTYVSRDREVLPETTACKGNLTAAEMANMIQVSGKGWGGEGGVLRGDGL